MACSQIHVTHIKLDRHSNSKEHSGSSHSDHCNTGTATAIKEPQRKFDQGGELGEHRTGGQASGVTRHASGRLIPGRARKGKDKDKQTRAKQEAQLISGFANRLCKVAAKGK